MCVFTLNVHLSDPDLLMVRNDLMMGRVLGEKESERMCVSVIFR